MGSQSGNRQNIADKKRSARIINAYSRIKWKGCGGD